MRPVILSFAGSAVETSGGAGRGASSGTISLGDAVAVTEQKIEAIPYAVKDRIRWFLGKQNAALGAMDLVHGFGLPSSYARAVPRLVASMGFKWR